jgi:hypothetical protein
MSDTSLQPITEFEHFLNRLSEEDLRLLNRMVVERLKLYHKARDLKGLAKFNLMDKVCFDYEGKRITGRVLKLNRRSVTIRTDDGRQWNVSPAFLTRATG